MRDIYALTAEVVIEYLRRVRKDDEEHFGRGSKERRQAMTSEIISWYIAWYGGLFEDIPLVGVLGDRLG